jgi:hypothetical protein
MPIKDPQKRKECKAKYYKNNKEKHQNWCLQNSFGISLQEYNKMFENQKGCCAICNQHQIYFKKRLHVDHNHTTGSNRQLLCSQCNIMVGMAHEDLNVLQSAIDYLRKHNAV